MPHLRTAELRGEPITRLGHEVTPVGQSVRLEWRGGALEWRRPAAIEVRDGARLRRVPIYNATRRAIAVIALAGLTASISAGWFLRVASNERSR